MNSFNYICKTVSTYFRVGHILRISAAILMALALGCTIFCNGVVESIGLIVLAIFLVINVIINAKDYRDRFLKR